MIQIGKSGVLSSNTANDLDRLRAQFDQYHYVRLPRLLDPELLDFIQREIDRGEFYERIRMKPSVEVKELWMKPRLGADDTI